MIFSPCSLISFALLNLSLKCFCINSFQEKETHNREWATDQSESFLKEINSVVYSKECACNRSISVSGSIRPKQTGCGWGWKSGQARKTMRRKSWFDIGRQRRTRWISLELLKETMKRVINRLVCLLCLCWLSWEGVSHQTDQEEANFMMGCSVTEFPVIYREYTRSSHTYSNYSLFLLLCLNRNKN